MFVVGPLGPLRPLVPPTTILSLRHHHQAFVTQLAILRKARDIAAMIATPVNTDTTRVLWLPRRGHQRPHFVQIQMMVFLALLVLLQAMFPLLLLLLLGQTLPCPRRDSVTVILKSQPALFVTLANTVHSMWACTAVAHVGGGFMQTALDGTLSPVLGVLPCSSGVRGIPTYVCHWHLDRRTRGIASSAGSSTSKLHDLRTLPDRGMTVIWCSVLPVWG